jgi:dipeptidyl aminopeptidase/acylaminoacyl peptidase
MKSCFRLALLVLAGSLPAGAQELVPVNLFVADLTDDNGAVKIGAPRKLTGDRGISSQPAFSPDGKSVVFVARRDSANAQSDVYRIDLATGAETRITSTPEMENSPTITPDGKLMVIRWVPETLFKEWGPWLYDVKTGQPLSGVLPGPDTVGYYVRVDSVTYAMVRPRNPSNVAIFDTRSRKMTDYEGPVGNLPPQLVPGRRAISYARTDSLGRNEIRELDLATLKSSTIAPAVLGRVAHAWTPRGEILMGKGNKVYALRPGSGAQWREIAAFTDRELRSITAYTVSPAGDKLILLSPVKPQLHQLINDSLEAGRTTTEALAPYEGLSLEVLASLYEISRGNLTALANAQKRRRPGDAALIDAFFSRFAPPPAR